MRGKSMEVLVHKQLTHHPMKAKIETSQTWSNLVKPTECWSIGAMGRIGGGRQSAVTFASPPPIYCIVAETPKLRLIKANQG
jgi:hypothetical protein